MSSPEPKAPAATDQPQRGGVGVVVSGSLPLPPAEAANFFHFTVVGQEIQFLVGTINLIRIHEATRKKEPTTLVPEITHRFILSPFGFAALRSQLEEIAKVVPRSDVGVGHEAE